MKTTKTVLPFFTLWRWTASALADDPCCDKSKRIESAAASQRTGFLNLPLFCVLLVCCSTSMCSAACTPSTAGPSLYFDLNHWNLLLPVDNNDTTNSNPAKEIQTTDLTNRFEYLDPNASCVPKYFKTGTGGTMVFATPWCGAPAAGQARSELRETTRNGNENNWIPGLGGTHIMTAGCFINQAGQGKITIGQIHAETPLGFNNKSQPVIMLYYEGRSSNNKKVRLAVYDTVYGKDNDVPADGNDDKHYDILTNVDENDYLKYEIKLVGSATSCDLYVKVSNETKGGGYQYPRITDAGVTITNYPLDLRAKDTNWCKVAPNTSQPTSGTNNATSLYFKAGCYYSKTDNAAANYTAQVTFTNLVLDADQDGVSDAAEEYYGTDPQDFDSDADGIDDWEEIYNFGTNPTNADTDGDQLEDGYEINTYGTSPLWADTDGDGLSDYAELHWGSDPFEPDSDQDGMYDGFEDTYFGCPWCGDPNADSDNDGINNYGEWYLALDPTLADTDGDGFNDYDEYYVYYTDPRDSGSHP